MPTEVMAAREDAAAKADGVAVRHSIVPGQVLTAATEVTAAKAVTEAVGVAASPTVCTIMEAQHRPTGPIPILLFPKAAVAKAERGPQTERTVIPICKIGTVMS